MVFSLRVAAEEAAAAVAQRQLEPTRKSVAREERASRNHKYSVGPEALRPGRAKRAAASSYAPTRTNCGGHGNSCLAQLLPLVVVRLD